MANNPDITLILPAYNEVNSIEQTLSETIAYFSSRQLRYEIVVAADGNDGTREVVMTVGRKYPAIRAIGGVARRGKGRGIREAVAIASGDIIGFADADNKVPIQEFGKLEPWLRRGCHVVIGSRGDRNSVIERKQPWYRRVGSLGFYWFLKAMIGLSGVRDTQCGFKFFPRDVAKHLFRCQIIDGYMFDVEILVLAQRFGYQIKEVPIRWRDDGDSRLELFRGNIRNIRDVLHIRLSTRRRKELWAQRAAGVGQPEQ